MKNSVKKVAEMALEYSKNALGNFAELEDGEANHSNYWLVPSRLYIRFIFPLFSEKDFEILVLMRANQKRMSEAKYRGSKEGAIDRESFPRLLRLADKQDILEKCTPLQRDFLTQNLFVPVT